MIYYSVQNQFDLCPVNWTFDDSSGRFYNWKNQPADQIVKIPPRKVRNQLYVYDIEATNIDLTVRAINAHTGLEIPGIIYIFSIPTSLPGLIYEFFVDASLISPYVNFYLEMDVVYDSERTDSYRSSCFTVEVNEDDKLIKISYGNTITDRFIDGVLFFEGTFQQRFFYADKYDTEIEIVNDEQSNDFNGNAVLVDKTHKETDVFEIIEMPKKFFMGLLSISENDIIYVNGRKSLINLEKVTEAKIGSYEIPYINALMRVVYSDNDGLLDTANISEADYLLINDTDHLLINEINILKTR